MVPHLPRDDPGTVWLTATVVVDPRCLDRHVDPLRATGGKDHPVETFGGKSDNALGKLNRLVVGELEEAGEVGEAGRLLGHYLAQLSTPVADLRQPVTGAGHVQQFIAAGIPDSRTLAADDDDPVGAVAGQERVD